jgi:YVTN family beta-propeller protein
MDADGGRQRPLTNNIGFCGVPVWSPDGSRIAYQCTEDLQRTDKGKPWQLFIVSAAGGAPRPLTQSSSNDQVPNWSPDGKRIIFYSDRTGSDQLYVIGADGSEPKLVTRSSTPSRVGSWAPDGKRVLFQSGQDGRPSDIFVTSDDGANIVRLTSTGTAQGVPFFSPDGRSIVFNAMVNGSSRIWLMNADGTSPRVLGAAVDPPASEEVVLVSYSGEDATGLIDPRTGKVLLRIPVGKNPHEITLTRDRARAYVATTGGAPGARTSGTPNAIAALDLRERRVLPNLDLETFESPHDVRVSADGATVWVACAPAQSVVEIDARSGRVVTAWRTGADGGWFLSVTPDGSKIYVPHLEGKRVSVINRATRSVSTVLEGGAQSGIDMSPDGRSVWVIDHEQRTINVIDTGTDRMTARIQLSSSDFGRLRFAPDGSRVVLVQGTSMTVFDVSERQPAGVIILPFPGKVVDTSPSGDRAVVSHPADDRVSIVDLAARTILTSISTGKTPDGVAWVR